MSADMHGVWIGKDSVVAVTDVMSITFLRLKEDLIASILRYNETGVIAVTYGHGNEYIGKNHTHTATVICDGDDKIAKNNDEASDFIKLHSSDKISFDEQNDKLIYTTYDSKVFENTLAEKIESDCFNRKNDIDDSLSIMEKMARWNSGLDLNTSENAVRAGINTRKYSIFYAIDLNGNQYESEYNEFIYCRVGQNGYCEKGYAMLPTIQIRHHHTSMLVDNLSSINDYKPNEDWFIEDGCSFPEDGGWYWAIKEITDDIIYLQGCEGDIYQIHRKRS